MAHQKLNPPHPIDSLRRQEMATSAKKDGIGTRFWLFRRSLAYRATTASATDLGSTAGDANMNTATGQILYQKP